MQENEFLEEKKLLNFNNYDDYLDSFVTVDDLKYLQSTEKSREIASLGYRSTAVTYTKSEFERRLNLLRDYLYPKRKPHYLASYQVKIDDEFLNELAIRERPNRTGLLATIIFMRFINRRGSEISGYIDYEDSLKKYRSRVPTATDWHAVFCNEIYLKPTKYDLGYYNWRTGYSIVNDTHNFKAITDPVRGLTFIYKGDRKTLIVDPLLDTPGYNSIRIDANSDIYKHAVFYDHIVRQRL